MIKQLFKKIHELVDYFYNILEEQKEVKQLQKQKLVLQQQNQQIYQFMLAMRVDLFESFKDHSYANLMPITNPSQLRIHNYKRTDHGIEYYFKLSKKSENLIARILIAEIKDHMNTDIAATASDIMNCLGVDYLFNIHPYLANGLYVIAIQDTGLSDVIITVQTLF